ncbi:MAG: ACP S-malonyltransferase [Chlamydiae bacterium]|nr:ACP S-malonyltransferase [Chlamydiota bacterium]MBI3266742.1 ACP S-malonyltransferase [Chlamydiota bacterium]
MQRHVFLFPGQGAQYVGMGRDLFERYEAVRRIFAQASEILKEDLTKICFEGPEETLTSTRICQSAIFTVSFACLEALKVECPHLVPEAVAGLSLGEFTALTVAGSLTFEEGLRLVQARGRLMQEACLEKKGIMASILGLEYEKVKEICSRIQDAVVTVANVNSDQQVVVSGDPQGVEKALEEAKKRGARRAILLQVSGAFHSPLMQSAREKLEKFLEHFEIRPPQKIFISNVKGEGVEDPQEIRKLLVAQVTDPVLWSQGIQYLIQKGFSSFIEVGCGRVLSGLQKKIAPDTKILNVDGVESLEKMKKIVESEECKMKN